MSAEAESYPEESSNKIRSQQEGSLVNLIIEKSDEAASLDHDAQKRNTSDPELHDILESIRGIINNHKKVVTEEDSVEGDSSEDLYQDHNGSKILSESSILQNDNSFSNLHSSQETESQEISTSENHKAAEMNQLEDSQSSKIIKDISLSDNKLEDNPDDVLELTEIIEHDSLLLSNTDDSSNKSPLNDNNLISKAVLDQSLQSIDNLIDLAQKTDSVNKLDNESEKKSSNQESMPNYFAETTLNQMMLELMRPMMKEWLDNNLPNLVEKIVREEIKKLTSKK